MGEGVGAQAGGGLIEEDGQDLGCLVNEGPVQGY